MKLVVLLFLPFLCYAQEHISYDGTTGVIYSPNYPGDYPNSANYVYTITVPTGNFIHLTFFDFLTEDSYDYMTVENYTLSGDQTGLAIDIQASQATLTFKSDLTTTYRGFAIQYDQVPVGSVFMPSDQCSNWSLTSTYGIVTSPNYPENYPDNMSCGVTIEVENGHLISLQFLAFDTEDSYDIVTVFDADNQDDTKILGTFSGKAVPQTLTSTGNHMRIQFSSDLVKNFSGFSALYTSFVSNDFKRGVLPQTYTTDSILKRENQKLLEWLKKKAGSNTVINTIGSN
ncbi:Protein CBG06640 [Caenorhabditis briggsae]|uniref:CUB domain-containing protein n=2 Tax=Caenorhabditis briggsae TaxID=6238 RepID=A0AAE9F4K5_CAEBR|nr:Protein CBG06640 [Caenorhabditis briggsae]ULT88172.1 hypothetical protein L3Y34_007405 [Caenorhabditis briggsae]UMM33977.1 hypothetical protein L5515_007252 [Caenorhabditis briggsae]CAP26918.1 Protein CBG06640 [Caenorhabditis briggsae]